VEIDSQMFRHFRKQNTLKMKKSIWSLSVFVFAASIIFTSCDTPAQKVENAESNVVEAKEELVQAQQDYLADVESYKQQTAEKIAANKQSIAEFNARAEAEKKEVQADYKAKIAELEKKNNDLKLKLDTYKVESKSQWETFKIEFSREMDQIAATLKDLTAKKN
jgi:preprotein translocase subunit SecF